MKNKNKELEIALTQFLKILYVDFGIEKFSGKIKNWYMLNWDEFKRELENEKVKFNTCTMSDWEDFFHHHKSKVLNLMS